MPRRCAICLAPITAKPKPARDPEEGVMTDVPAQRTEPDTGELKVRAPQRFRSAGHPGRSSEQVRQPFALGEGYDGHIRQRRDKGWRRMVEVYDEVDRPVN